ncbi:ATP-dependent helicase [Alteribacillus iranensis]|uniref:UvrD-like helicase C-terminal domain-containing protein n=1 Tax=Alteribacillus iranensis TaxID=930128 RepID=A0A1I2DK47_9BACI|nr:ATP-dependent helicase [Alteribacillus iranensis]SFE80681.1 UvrD-like helicase C-terminal domain-containing protein [Alteribacillus iranensis]
MSDTLNRKAILEDEENIVVSAGAGSGKTTILINKLNLEIEENKTHYKVAAVTFTNKAAEELKDKLGKAAQGHFFGTNDSFVEQEVIRPFIKDAYGNKFSGDFETEYYTTKFRSFQKGLKELKNKNILGTYYEKKRNFKFELAIDILNNSASAKQYLQAKYFRIFIDEYQDSDTDMHSFFMYLKEHLHINMFIVGDPKQSIYEWRGANPENFRNLLVSGHEFNTYELTQNFRCSISIQNYANLFFTHTCKQFQRREEKVVDVIGLTNSYTLEDLYDNNYLDPNKELTILRRKRNDAENIAINMNKHGHNFSYIPRTPLDKATKNSRVLKELAAYSKDKKHSVYHVINNLGIDLSAKEIREIESEIDILKNDHVNYRQITGMLEKLSSLLQINILEDELDSFTKVIYTDEYDVAFKGDSSINKAMTLHSSKGLEFDQVLFFASDLKVFKGEDLNEHYVATTRGKEKLIIVLDEESYLNYLQELIQGLGLDSLDELIKII